MNIILTGMPGSGKSTIGIVLAKIIGFQFIDTDILIQKETGKLLQNIINSEGVDHFLALEERILQNLTCDGYIIATGGSAVYSDAAMERLKKNGVVVFINVLPEILEKRVKDYRSRGIAGAADKTLRQLYTERIGLYRKYADIIIENGTENAGRACEKILNNKIIKNII